VVAAPGAVETKSVSRADPEGIALRSADRGQRRRARTGRLRVGACLERPRGGSPGDRGRGDRADRTTRMPCGGRDL